MDPSVLKAIEENDVAGFERLVEEDKTVLEQRTAGSFNTLLHQASRVGHADLARVILKLHPGMISAENARGDTPLHEACRMGNVHMVKLLLEITTLETYSVNSTNESPFSIACSMGYLEIVKLMLDEHWLINAEELTNVSTALHKSILRKNKSVVKAILEARPNFAWQIDKDGCLPMHCACENGNLEIARILLDFAPKSCMKFNKNGYTPLHLAAIKGEAPILAEIRWNAAEAFGLLTKEGETVFHLAAKSGNYHAFICLYNIFKDNNLLQATDPHGNTVLHLAVCATSRYDIAEYLIYEKIIDLDAQNHSGLTALDILQQDKSDSKRQVPTLIPLLIKAGGKRGTRSSKATIQAPVGERNGSNSRQKSVKEELPERSTNQLKKMQAEALQNARNTITIVAVLIATVSFAAGISPPGGVYQDGPMKGKSLVGRTTAFKIFEISNTVALFTSLSVVVILVRIISFRRKRLLRILKIADRVMWVAVWSMGTSYLAATMVITPHNHGTEWLSLWVIAMGSGALGITFVVVALILTTQWYHRKKWRKPLKKAFGLGSVESEIAPNYHRGFHSL